MNKSADRTLVGETFRFDVTLSLLQLTAKKLDLLLQLVESFAWKALKEEVAPKRPTTIDLDNIANHIPWDFVPNVDDYRRRELAVKNRRRFEQLKSHVKSIARILDEVVVKGRQSQ